MQNTVLLTNWVHDEVLEFLGQHCQVIANPDRQQPMRRDEIFADGAAAQAMIAFMPDMVDDEFLERMPQLAFIACALKGTDNFDIDAIHRRGVQVSYVPDLLTVPTAELTIGLMIGLGRHVLAGDRNVRSGTFQGWRATLYGAGLAGATVGVIGLGAIGLAIAERLRAFDCHLIYTEARRLSHDREDALHVGWRDLSDLLTDSDYVVVAAPLNDSSQHLINAEALAQMKPGALLINPSRGSVVDELAVADALETGRLGGYAADVFEMEDWARRDRPREINAKLLAMPDRTLFTPHLGSAVDQVRLQIAYSAATSVVQFFAGDAPDNLLQTAS